MTPVRSVLAALLALLAALPAVGQGIMRPCRMDGADCFTAAYTNITGISASKLLGRGSSGAGAAQEITPGTGLTISGTTLTPDVSGSGASGRLALWSSASGLTSDAGLMYSGSAGQTRIFAGTYTDLDNHDVITFGYDIPRVAPYWSSLGLFRVKMAGGINQVTSLDLGTSSTSPIRFFIGGSFKGAFAGDGALQVGSTGTGLSEISAGVVGVGTGTAGSTAGGLALTSVRWVTGTRPTCDAAARGTSWYVAGGAGAADTIEICLKSAADTYAWTALATP